MILFLTSWYIAVLCIQRENHVGGTEMFGMLLSSAHPKSRTFQCPVLCIAQVPQRLGSMARRADPTWPKGCSIHRLTWPGCELGGVGWEEPGAAGGRAGHRSEGAEHPRHCAPLTSLGFYSSVFPFHYNCYCHQYLSYLYYILFLFQLLSCSAPNFYLFPLILISTRKGSGGAKLSEQLCGI